MHLPFQVVSPTPSKLPTMLLQYCNCIVTRGRVYNEILPEPEENPESGARGISRGLRQYFIVYPD